MKITPLNTTLVWTSNLSIGFRNDKNRIRLLQEKIDLSLNEGDFVCLIGPNGCGKSTLIRTLSGIDNPIEGTVWVGQKNVHELSDAERSKWLGIVLTDQAAVENITVEEIVSLGRYHYAGWFGTLGTSDQKKVNWAIRQVGLSGYEDRHYKTLSDGEKQRAFIAKVLCSDAPLLILDEPTAHLDIPNRVEIMMLLRKLSREIGRAVLISTHELDLALQLSDEIWLMDPGQPVFNGTPEELLITGSLDRAFGNSQLHFNPHSGSFCVETTYAGKLLLQGSGTLTEYTRQAVQRLGFQTEKEGQEALRIEVDEQEDKWIIRLNKETWKFTNLLNVCRFLKNYEKNQTTNEYNRK